MPFEIEFPSGALGTEDYLLRSRADGVWLLGATELAVEHAVWDLLYRLGYRQFFPGAVWEVVPRTDDVTVAVDVRESPDYHARRLWYNWGRHWHCNEKPYAHWCSRNRSARGFVVANGHIYEAIMDAYPEVFQKHPEYYALRNGERKRLEVYGTKFCIANPGLREFVASDAMKRLGNTDGPSITMEPSDGGHWCQCEACAEMGSITDQAITLANEVAAAINKPDKGENYVGILAYHRHSPPPNLDVHPNVIVSVATSFLQPGWSLDKIITGWKARGATLGICDYFSVVAWDWNLPGRARSANPTSLANNLRKLWNQGARFHDAESGDAWGPYGLGFYVASRIWWDVDEANHVDELVDDFLARAFGPAQEPMEEFYDLITTASGEDSLPELTRQMYRHLAAARELAGEDPDVRTRIDHLILYTRYVKLYHTSTRLPRRVCRTRQKPSCSPTSGASVKR